MADVNVKRGGMGTPERMALRKKPTSVSVFPLVDQ